MQPIEPVAVVGDAWVMELSSKRELLRDRLDGAAFQTAIDLRQLGVPTRLVTVLGDDEDGEAIRRRLARSGVQLLANEDSGAETMRVRITKKNRTKPAQKGQDRPRIRFTDEQVAAIDQAPVVVVAGFAFDDRKQQRKLLEHVLQPQNRLVIDANPRAGLIDDLDDFRDHLERHASSALLVHISEDDAQLCFDGPLDEATTHLLDLGAKHVLATNGAGGARWVNRRGVDVHVPVPITPGEIVSVSGAGAAVTAVAAAAFAIGGTQVDEARATRICRRATRVAAAIVGNPDGVLSDADELPELSDLHGTPTA